MSKSTTATAEKVVIMGAGPAGLTAAYELSKHDIATTVLERDPRYVGGIARTVDKGGYRFDLGGHRFFSKNMEIEDLWTEILGSEMLERARLSRIYYRGKYFDYPLKAFNALRNLGPFEAAKCMLSYVWARARPVKNPRSLEDWVTNQFGKRLFRIFFKTYTEKVWGIPTSELSADWAAQRIKGLDMAQLIKTTLFPWLNRNKGDRGALIKTLIDAFRYPRLGPGQMWERVVEVLREKGNSVEMGQEVVRVNHDGSRVTSVTVRDREGRERQVEGSDFISTLPIRELIDKIQPAVPAQVRENSDKLDYRDFLTVALMIDRADVFPDNWIYIHDPGVKVGRIQNFKNWSPWMVPDQSKTGLGLEYFCFEGDGLWSSSDEELVELGKRELAQLGMCSPEEVFDGAVVRVQKAYPVYDDHYKERVEVVRSYLAGALPNLHLVGRNGMHKYNNQDHSMMTALIAARRIEGVTQQDPWKVNTDAEYHEEVRDSDLNAGRMVPVRVEVGN